MDDRHPAEARARRDSDERQPQVVAGRPVERDARPGLPAGVALDDLADGPAVRRLGDDRVVVTLLAPRAAAPVAITMRATKGRDGRQDRAGVDAVFLPTIARAPHGTPQPWSYVLRLPASVDATAPLVVRVTGLGTDHVVEVPAAD